jgi:hypothetical protein
MGYSFSDKTWQQVENELKQILIGGHTSFLCDSNLEATKLAYKVREALFITKRKGHPEYGHLKDRVTLKVIKNEVHVFPSDSIAERESRIVKRDATNLREVLGVCILSKDAKELLFPNAHLSDNELNRLYLWCKDQGRYVILSGDGIIVSDSDNHGIAYTP